jgi:hypothetical protein
MCCRERPGKCTRSSAPQTWRATPRDDPRHAHRGSSRGGSDHSGESFGRRGEFTRPWAARRATAAAAVRSHSGGRQGSRRVPRLAVAMNIGGSLLVIRQPYLALPSPVFPARTPPVLLSRTVRLFGSPRLSTTSTPSFASCTVPFSGAMPMTFQWRRLKRGLRRPTVARLRECTPNAAKTLRCPACIRASPSWINPLRFGL